VIVEPTGLERDALLRVLNDAVAEIAPELTTARPSERR
jgi:hypothetical protein